jgi:small subunit ribosomal protein S18
MNIMRIKIKKPIVRKKSLLSPRKKFCRFCVDKAKVINYKELKILESFIKERAKILSRRFSGNCAKHQRRLCEEIKRARFLSLLPYTKM